MAAMIRRARLQPLRPRQNHFESLVTAIISQQLSSKAADTIVSRFKKLFGSRFPSPGLVARTSAKTMRRAGLSAQKISYIKNLARGIERGEINFAQLAQHSDETVIETLVRYKGIGRWTAEMFLIFSLARPNVFSVGDLGLRNALWKHYRIDARRHTRKLAKLLRQWHPHHSLASRHLWASLSWPESAKS